MEVIKIPSRPFIPGSIAGTALASLEPLSFWGGYDWQTGEIIDRRHPLSGLNARGKVLVIPSARGSSTTTAVFLEAIRAGTAPCAIVTTSMDFFFALASVVADQMYSKIIPLASISQSDFTFIRTGDGIRLDPNGWITISR